MARDTFETRRPPGSRQMADRPEAEEPGAGYSPPTHLAGRYGERPRDPTLEAAERRREERMRGDAEGASDDVADEEIQVQVAKTPAIERQAARMAARAKVKPMRLNDAVDQIKNKRDGGKRRDKREPITPMNRPDMAIERAAGPKVTVREAAESGTSAGGIGSVRRAVVGETEQGWTRTNLPSQCVPYTFDDVHIRPLDVPELIAIWAAVEAKSDTLFYDALNPCLNVDIRDLTEQDMRFLMYWWRLNSYPSSPFTVEWRGRYGNNNKTTIYDTTTIDANTQEHVRVSRNGQAELEIIPLAMTHDEYAVYRDEWGIGFPTIRDAEAIGKTQLKAAERFQAERAQYLLPSDPNDLSLKARFADLAAGGIELLEKIREFRGRIEHGVIERIRVTDPRYEATAAMEFLREQARQLKLILEASNGEGVSPETLLSQAERAQDYLNEAEEIEQLLEKGGKPQPREEVIPLNINVMNFFPEI